jgi:hypothetical protein
MVEFPTDVDFLTHDPLHLVEFPTDVDFLTYEPPGYSQISDHWRVLDSIGGKIRRYSDARASRTHGRRSRPP